MVENQSTVQVKKQLKKKYDVLSEPDDDDCENDSDIACGIYTKKICQTKKELTEIHTTNYLNDLTEKSEFSFRVASSVDALSYRFNCQIQSLE